MLSLATNAQFKDHNASTSLMNTFCAAVRLFPSYQMVASPTTDAPAAGDNAKHRQICLTLLTRPIERAVIDTFNDVATMPIDQIRREQWSLSVVINTFRTILQQLPLKALEFVVHGWVYVCALIRRHFAEQFAKEMKTFKNADLSQQANMTRPTQKDFDDVHFDNMADSQYGVTGSHLLFLTDMIKLFGNVVKDIAMLYKDNQKFGSKGAQTLAEAHSMLSADQLNGIRAAHFQQLIAAFPADRTENRQHKENTSEEAAVPDLISLIRSQGGENKEDEDGDVDLHNLLGRKPNEVQSRVSALKTTIAAIAKLDINNWTHNHIQLLYDVIDAQQQQQSYENDALLRAVAAAIKSKPSLAWGDIQLTMLTHAIRDPTVSVEGLQRISRGLSTRIEERQRQGLLPSQQALYDFAKRHGSESLQTALRFHDQLKDAEHRAEVTKIFEPLSAMTYVDHAQRKYLQSVHAIHKQKNMDQIQLLASLAASKL